MAVPTSSKRNMSFTASQERRFVNIKTMHGSFFEVRALFFLYLTVYMKRLFSVLKEKVKFRNRCSCGIFNGNMCQTLAGAVRIELTTRGFGVQPIVFSIISKR